MIIFLLFSAQKRVASVLIRIGIVLSELLFSISSEPGTNPATTYHPSTAQTNPLPSFQVFTTHVNPSSTSSFHAGNTQNPSYQHAGSSHDQNRSQKRTLSSETVSTTTTPKKRGSLGITSERVSELARVATSMMPADHVYSQNPVQVTGSTQHAHGQGRKEDPCGATGPAVRAPPVPPTSQMSGQSTAMVGQRTEMDGQNTGSVGQNMGMPQSSNLPVQYFPQQGNITPQMLMMQPVPTQTGLPHDMQRRFDVEVRDKILRNGGDLADIKELQKVLFDPVCEIKFSDPITIRSYCGEGRMRSPFVQECIFPGPYMAIKERVLIRYMEQTESDVAKRDRVNNFHFFQTRQIVFVMRQYYASML